MLSVRACLWMNIYKQKYSVAREIAIKHACVSNRLLLSSSLRSEDSFSEYYSEMPWLALPYNDPRKKALARIFEIQGERVFC